MSHNYLSLTSSKYITAPFQSVFINLETTSAKKQFEVHTGNTWLSLRLSSGQ